MTEIKQIYDYLDSFAPFHTQYSWDNSGLQCGTLKAKTKGVTLALDLTEEVLEEAAAKRHNLILTHHPLIFHPVKQVKSDSLLYRAIQFGITVISAHTNLDVSPCGVNTALAQALELADPQPLELAKQQQYHKIVVFVPKEHGEAVYEAMAAAGGGRLGDYEKCAYFCQGEGRFLPMEQASPFIGVAGRTERVPEVRLEMIVSPQSTKAVVAAMLGAHPYELPAYDVFENQAVADAWHLGLVGDLPFALSAEELGGYVKARLNAGGVRVADGGTTITKVAVCGGSGGSLVDEAISRGAQALVTGDVKHDVLLEAVQKGLTIVDAGHFATEAVALPLLAQKLREAFPGLAIQVALANRDPAIYI